LVFIVGRWVRRWVGRLGDVWRRWVGRLRDVWRGGRSRVCFVDHLLLYVWFLSLRLGQEVYVEPVAEESENAGPVAVAF
jgi:hypothetical protein